MPLQVGDGHRVPFNDSSLFLNLKGQMSLGGKGSRTKRFMAQQSSSLKQKLRFMKTEAKKKPIEMF